MKINEKILSIPPYLSTTWEHISMIRMKGHILVISLKTGEEVPLPGLKPETIESIFAHHTLFIEKGHSSFPQESSSIGSLPSAQPADSTFRIAVGPLEGLGIGAAMQHNSEQSNAPDLPVELIQKVSQLARTLLPDDPALLPKAESNCNCFFCQIARALNPSTSFQEEAEVEEVSDTELQFQQWDIIQTGDKLFSVTNRLDNHERYSVYLGQPVGCTCGKSGCEHILAVLKS